MGLGRFRGIVARTVGMVDKLTRVDQDWPSAPRMRQPVRRACRVTDFFGDRAGDFLRSDAEVIFRRAAASVSYIRRP